MDIREVLDEFNEKIKDLYGARLRKIILYGSWARGKADEDSDIDLLVVLKDDVSPGLEIDAMIDIITEINMKHNVLISVYPVSERDYSTVQSPLLLNIRKEGIRA